MSTSLAKTKRRIRSIESTEKTTKAMELIASVKVKRFRLAHEKGARYAAELADLASYLFRNGGDKECLSARLPKGDLPSLYIAIGSKMGLCGAYNNNIYKAIERMVGANDFLAPIGEKVYNHYARNGLYKNLIGDYRDLGPDTDPSRLLSVIQSLQAAFEGGRYAKIVLIYTHYRNSITFTPLGYQLLPLALSGKSWPHESYCPPELEGGAKALLSALLPEYLFATFHSLLLESSLSEEASRRTAMDNANENADELLEKLGIEYNKARQSAITQEITEVIGGANANAR